MNYRGTYDNGNDSSDETVAHGFNYHQGPEWLWVMGYFLRAYYYFNTQAPGHDENNVLATKTWIGKVIQNHNRWIHDFRLNPYAGLPELTNENGGYCYFGCPTQAWSASTMIELMHDLNGIKIQ